MLGILLIPVLHATLSAPSLLYIHTYLCMCNACNRKCMHMHECLCAKNVIKCMEICTQTLTHIPSWRFAL